VDFGSRMHRRAVGSVTPLRVASRRGLRIDDRANDRERVR